MSVEIRFKYMDIELDVADNQRILMRRVREIEDYLKTENGDARLAIVAMDEPFYGSLRFLAAICGINIDRLFGFTVNGQPKMAAEAGRLVLDAVEKIK